MKSSLREYCELVNKDIDDERGKVYYVGERLSYSSYMIADVFVISDMNEFCNHKKNEK